MSVNSKMTSIADKIRSLLGINGKLGLDAMDTNLESANTEVATQEELMEEILTTLAEKSANTGGIDTSDATATAEDMAEGVTAYVDGEMITGILPKTSLNSLYADKVYFENSLLRLNKTYDSEFICKKPSHLDYVPVTLCAKGSDLGDAIAEDVAQGKTFTSASGLKIEGTAVMSSGYVIKSGTTTSATINTGLSKIKEFFLYKKSLSSTGLINLHYSDASGTNYLYASSWSNTNKTVRNATTNATVNGGSLTIPSTSATSGGLSNNTTYDWIAVGEE